jgi:hypothetical protein
LSFPGGAEGRITSSFERDRDVSDGPDLLVEAAGGRLEVDGFISPHAGHSLRHWDSDGVFRQWTVAGFTSYDYQLDSFVRTMADPPSKTLDGQDLVGDAVTIEAAYVAMRL